MPLAAGETVKSKKQFEAVIHTHGVSVKYYHADNFPFCTKTFVVYITTKSQTIDYTGVGAKHQNAVAEQAIQTVTSWARTMMLHEIIMWPDQANLELWPFALNQAVFIWNHLPKEEGGMSPVELLSNTKVSDYSCL